jgi:predicted HAD superfamily Cof-like phosphohydrolase
MRYQEKVEQFMLAGEQDAPLTPTIPDANTAWLRMNMLISELNEYKEAKSACTYAGLNLGTDRTTSQQAALVNMADALADMVYVNYGTAAAYGIDLDNVLDIVHDANMRKLVDGKVIKDEFGKIQKPKGWTPPEPEIHAAMFGGSNA